MNMQQKRTSFKYWKFEPQEQMDGKAKARDFVKQADRDYVLAARYRLRPFTYRFQGDYSVCDFKSTILYLISFLWIDFIFENFLNSRILK